MKKIIYLLGMAIIFSGCSILQPTASICDSAEKSIICDAAAKINTTPESIGNLLIVANASLIAAGKYSREDAVMALQDIRSYLDQSVSYYFVKTIIFSIIEDKPELLIPSALILSNFNDTRIMYKADREMLKSWLDAQILNLE